MVRRRWWKEAIAYQIYPRSYQDSNGDGIGDLPGIIQRLDYIKDLGIDLIWICPIFKSPNDDNGYDISDYRDIMDVYGNLGDMERLIKEVHDRNMKVIFDMVLNHTSDEHSWFIEARSSRTSAKRDWYIWRDGKPGGMRPNNWESIFNGSAWEYDKASDQYYLHLFSRKMPDLNWENADLRQELYKICNWWLEKGIDGFRIDAVSHIKKKPGLPDLPNPKQVEFVSSFDYHMNVEGIEEYLREFRHATFGTRDLVSVGEANGVGADQAQDWVDEDTGIFNMIFQFEGTNLWEKTLGTLDVLALKRIMTRWQKALEKNGWNALFIENHDKPRIVSSWGDDKEYLRECATAFATVYLLMMGTPFIYQGQEIGMTNVKYPSINDYNDVAAKSFYNLELAKGIDEQEIMQIIYITGRDNARTPMQWDDSPNAGFSTAQQTWLGVNPNYVWINVEHQSKDENSILNFYKRLIKLRKANELFIYGTYDLILSSHKQVYGYTRTLNDKRAYILTNLTDRPAQFTLYQGLSLKHLVLTNLVEPIQDHNDEKSFKFRPYEIRVYIIDHKHHKSHTTAPKNQMEPSKRLPSDELKSTRSASDITPTASKMMITKRQKKALEKLQQQIKSDASVATNENAVTNENAKTTEEEEVDPDEPLIKKRERQRSLVLNLENIGFIPDSTASTPHRKSFSSFSTPLLKGRHDVDNDIDNDDETTTSTDEVDDEESSDTGNKDIDYSVLYDETIEDFSYSGAREQAKKRLLRDQNEEMLRQNKEQEQS
ncbi:unnamed protein product [Didymodactylos carnosus]|uniref:Glycosyl hydrolase family 13 catalytic domain-containing protein n=1 Tax=Didymodactylos carnosus TaxID=1234261 RepID=A0A813TNL7_9BILA|nr:unnamed protein product [Didymodactylos carnosus]CAF0817092.1 unnamed protein product [Didymodactylos carnosus]CAF3556043.1 unnamed protein product [Didymodactylos carnosus]CAF3603305.1 unnamed protein product [Didymodactylos carnosus]